LRGHRWAWHQLQSLLDLEQPLFRVHLYSSKLQFKIGSRSSLENLPEEETWSHRPSGCRESSEMIKISNRKSERDILNLLKELLTDKQVPSQIRNQLLISPMRTLKKNINLLIPASQQAVTVPRRLPTLMRAKMIMSNISRAILRIRIKEGS
jgi:hypothetical protein